MHPQSVLEQKSNSKTRKRTSNKVKTIQKSTYNFRMSSFSWELLGILSRVENRNKKRELDEILKEKFEKMKAEGRVS